MLFSRHFTVTWFTAKEAGAMPYKYEPNDLKKGDMVNLQIGLPGRFEDKKKGPCGKRGGF